MTASSTSSPWFPETPDNEIEIGRTFRAYKDALALLAKEQGIPGLMAELTRINAAQQAQGTEALASALTARLQQTVGSLDSITLRSRPTASPSRDSARDRGREDSRQSQQPSQWPLPWRSAGGLGRAAAARIVAAQRRRADR